MKKFIFSCLLAGAVFLAPVAVSFSPSSGVLTTENRTMKKFPDLPKKMRTHSIRKYFRDIEGWFSDRLPLRSQLVALGAGVQRLGNGANDSSSCIQGRDGWLFLGNGFAAIIDVLEGRWKPAKEHTDAQVRHFVEMDRIVREAGAELHIMVGPNKCSIYPEFLPPVIFPAPTRHTDTLTAALQKLGLSAYDPTARLIEAKDEGIVYWRTDTHWNEFGVKVALEEFLKKAGLPPLPDMSLECKGTFRGGLINMGGFSYFPLTEGDAFKLEFPGKPQDDRRVLVIGDSFSEIPLQYFKAMFKHVDRVHMLKLLKHRDLRALKNKLAKAKRKYDLVIWIQVERCYVFWPSAQPVI